MGSIKRIALVFAAMALAAGLLVVAGCASTPTPTATVESAFNALKSGDFDKFSASYAGDLDSVKEALSSDYINGTGAVTDALTDDQKAVLTKFVTMLFSYDFTVSDEKIDGDSATVAVDFTSYDMASVFKNALSEYFKQAFSLVFTNALSGATSVSEQYAYILYDELSAQMENTANKTLAVQATVELKKTDGKWVIQELSDDAKNGLTGGLYTYIDQVSQSLNSLSSSLSS